MLSLDQLAAERRGDAWRIRWRIGNPDTVPLTIISAWLPHSRFRGAEWALTPPLVVPSASKVELDSTVAWDEAPGVTVENAFLILRLATGRVFARLTVTAGASGEPRAVCEAVTEGR